MVKLYFKGKEIPKELTEQLYVMLEYADKYDLIEKINKCHYIYFVGAVVGFCRTDRHTYILRLNFGFHFMDGDYDLLEVLGIQIENEEEKDKVLDFFEIYDNSYFIIELPAQDFEDVLTKAFNEWSNGYNHLHAWIKKLDTGVYELIIRPLKIGHPSTYPTYDTIAFQNGKILYLTNPKDILTIKALLIYS